MILKTEPLPIEYKNLNQVSAYMKAWNWIFWIIHLLYRELPYKHTIALVQTEKLDFGSQRELERIVKVVRDDLAKKKITLHYYDYSTFSSKAAEIEELKSYYHFVFEIAHLKNGGGEKGDPNSKNPRNTTPLVDAFDARIPKGEGKQGVDQRYCAANLLNSMMLHIKKSLEKRTVSFWEDLLELAIECAGEDD